jgi:hypothetical protein
MQGTVDCVSSLHRPRASKIRGFLDWDQSNSKSSVDPLTSKYFSRSLSPEISRAGLSLLSGPI